MSTIQETLYTTTLQASKGLAFQAKQTDYLTKYFEWTPFTPTLLSSTVTSTEGTVYKVVGNTITVMLNITASSLPNGSLVAMTGLPVPSASDNMSSTVIPAVNSTAGTIAQCLVSVNLSDASTASIINPDNFVTANNYTIAGTFSYQANENF